MKLKNRKNQSVVINIKAVVTSKGNKTDKSHEGLFFGTSILNIGLGSDLHDIKLYKI